MVVAATAADALDDDGDAVVVSVVVVAVNQVAITIIVVNAFTVAAISVPVVLFVITVNCVAVINDDIVCLFFFFPLSIQFSPVIFATTDVVITIVVVVVVVVAIAVAVAGVAFTFVTVSSADVADVVANIKASSFTLRLNSSEDNCCFSIAITVGTVAVAAGAASTFIFATLCWVYSLLCVPIRAGFPTPMVVVMLSTVQNNNACERPPS